MCWGSVALAQNPNWLMRTSASYPSKIYFRKGAQVFRTDYNTLPTIVAENDGPRNAWFNEIGELIFYVTNSGIRDKDGVQQGTSFQPTATNGMNPDVVITPVPGTCNEYFVIHSSTFSGAGLSLPSEGGLAYRKVTVNNSNNTITVAPEVNLQGNFQNFESFGCILAISRPVETGQNNPQYLYALATQTNELMRFTVTATGLTNPTQLLGTTSSFPYAPKELELSRNGDRLVWVQQNTLRLLTLNPANGTIVSNNTYNITNTGIPFYPKGLELHPTDPNIYFFTGAGGIHRAAIVGSTVTVNATVSASQNYTMSCIETDYSDRMAVISKTGGGTSDYVLRTFNPAATGFLGFSTNGFNGVRNIRNTGFDDSNGWMNEGYLPRSIKGWHYYFVGAAGQVIQGTTCPSAPSWNGEPLTYSVINVPGLTYNWVVNKPQGSSTVPCLSFVGQGTHSISTSFCGNGDYEVKLTVSRPGCWERIITLNVNVGCINDPGPGGNTGRIAGPQEAITHLAEMKLQLYPNPVQDNLLTVDIEGVEKAEVRIIDLRGVEVRRSTLAQGSQTLDITQLPAGMYQMIATDGQQIVRQKFIKQ